MGWETRIVGDTDRLEDEVPVADRFEDEVAVADGIGDEAGGADDAPIVVAEDPRADRIEELSELIPQVFAQADAITYRGLELIAEFDRLRGWERSGHRDCAHWLAVRIGIERGAAHEKVRAARALTRLPLISQAMSRGELSFTKVRALTRKATADDEAELLDLAQDATAAQLERMLRAWEKGSRQDEAARERARYESRTLSIFPDDEGSYVIRGKLTPEVGALLMRAIEAAGDVLFRETAVPGVPVDPETSRREAAQRRADAIGLLAERAMAAGFGRGRVDLEEGTGEGIAATPAPAALISGSRADRYQVVLHVDAETLSESGSMGRSDLEDGTRLSADAMVRFWT